MALEYAFSFPLKNGLHARPASVLQEAAARFRSAATLANEARGAQASLASVLALVGSGTRQGDACLLRLEGPDEAEALAYFQDFLERRFPACDDDLPPPAEGASQALPPRVLTREGAAFLSGARASAGVGVGRCVPLRGLVMPEGLPQTAEDTPAEWGRFTQACQGLEGELAAAVDAAPAGTERGILKAHLSLLADPEFTRPVRRVLEERRCSIAAALLQAGEEIGAALGATGSAYLAARALDVQELISRLIARIYHLPEPRQAPTLAEDSVVVAPDLGPSQFMALDRAFLKGLVLGQTGSTSHTVILARALGIPCVTGVGEGVSHLRAGQRLIVDGQRGVVVPDPGPQVGEYYRQEQARLDARRQALAGDLARPATTADGHRLEIGANVATAEEAELALSHGGAEGIGVFRTEMLFMDRPAAPTEEEQVAIYRRVARAAGERPALVRLLDIGGDKPLPYLNMPQEANPFLGWRGVRIYPAFRELVLTQLRAILRGASEGNLKIMIPMVDTAEEIRWVRQAAEEAAEMLKQDGLAHRWPVPIGIMVETPAAALGLARLADEADFFSVGTNDLSQYFYAADRGNGRVAGLLGVRAPVFLELLKAAVDQAHARGKWIGLCGEMGGQARNLPLLAGLGLDEISMAPPAIPAMKAALGQWSFPDCQQAVAAAIQAREAAGVEAILDALPDPAAALPLIDGGVVVLDSAATSKELAIKELIDRLDLAGRVEEAETVEEAIWQREDIYATSVGFGIAIPHCKSARLRASTIGLLRLAEPLEWKPEDPGEDGDTRVRLIIMLAIREADHGDTHLRLFAQLARKVMHEEFREGLLTAATPAVAVALIREVLGL